MDRTLVKDEETGLMISVPANRLEQYRQRAKEGPRQRTPEEQEKLDKAWEILRGRIYGK